MSQQPTPRDYALAYLCRLESLWSAVHDGDVEAVHDARVATRRIRAVLPFVYTAAPGVADELRGIGRALGRVRELDVTKELLTRLDARIPQAASAVAITRREVDHHLAHQRRRMLKKLRHRPRSIARGITSGASVARLASFWRSWRHELRDSIRHRVTAAHSALERATAVYMPNRVHSARIALKRLRYMVEVAVATGLMGDAALAGLRSAQEALGDVHDMTVLAKMIDETHFPSDVATESAALVAVVAAETSRRHDRYVRRRERILAACEACVQELEHESRSWLAIPAVAVVAVPVLASWYVHHSSEDDQHPLKYQLPS